MVEGRKGFGRVRLRSLVVQGAILMGRGVGQEGVQVRGGGSLRGGGCDAVEGSAVV